MAWIAEVNAVYGALLSRPERLTHAEVVAADRAGWSAMLSVIARVLGAHPDDTEAEIEARRALLQPITDQQDELTGLRARRRGELFVDTLADGDAIDEVGPEPEAPTAPV